MWDWNAVLGEWVQFCYWPAVESARPPERLFIFLCMKSNLIALHLVGSELRLVGDQNHVSDLQPWSTLYGKDISFSFSFQRLVEDAVPSIWVPESFFWEQSIFEWEVFHSAGNRLGNLTWDIHVGHRFDPFLPLWYLSFPFIKPP